MILTDIRLQYFRSYQDSSFEFTPNVNIIVGPNASGKTNLLEALMMLAGHKSWRAQDSETISFNKAWTRLDSHTANGNRTLKIIRELHLKTYEIDNNTYKRLEKTKKLPVCLFEPNHLLILSGKPELRRDYIDELSEQVFPEFGLVRRQYARTLAQRNRLLKQKLASESIFSWNIRLTELAGQLVRRRLEILAKIRQQLPSIYKDLAASKDKVNITYSTLLESANYESSMLKLLEKNLDKELDRGFTLFGPHRDDLLITINSKPASLSASRGEARTMTLALKILESQILEEISGAKPLMLLDDVFSELDGRRRQQLTSCLKEAQTFITTTDADVVLAHFSNLANVIPLSK